MQGPGFRITPHVGKPMAMVQKAISLYTPGFQEGNRVQGPGLVCGSKSKLL